MQVLDQRVSMKAIAKEVGVSIMTVSRVMNGTGKVAPETAQKIQRVADRIHYRANRLVRGMQTGRTGLIGVVLPAGLGFYTGVLQGIHDHFSDKDESVLLSLIHGHTGERAIEEERKVLHRLVELRVDGIILRPANDEASPLYFEEIVRRKVPIVIVDRRLPNFSCDFVGTEDFAGGEEAARRLQARGANKLLLVTAGDKLSPSRDRARGFAAGIESKNVEQALKVLECPDFSSNEELIFEFLRSSGSEVNGIFAISDHLANGCLSALKRLNRQVPGDVSVIGFGAVGSGIRNPIPVSTFDQHPELIGRTAAELLTGRIEGDADPLSPPRTVRLAATFVDRGT